VENRPQPLVLIALEYGRSGGYGRAPRKGDQRVVETCSVFDTTVATKYPKGGAALNYFLGWSTVGMITWGAGHLMVC
jgi:hypothetical protein